MESNTIFRKKSVERMSSPEQLNDYIRVCTPGIWMLLVAIIVLLVGVCVWGVFGRLDTTITTVAIADGQSVTVYVSEDELSDVTGKTVAVGDAEYEITEDLIADAPVAVSEEVFSDYALHVSGLETGEWVYEITFDTELSDGVYEAEIVVESVSPMSFVLN